MNDSFQLVQSALQLSTKTHSSFSHVTSLSFVLHRLPLPVEERVVGPRDLQVSELAHDSLRLTWSQATGDVTGYRLLVAPLSSRGKLLPSQQRQVRDAW